MPYNEFVGNNYQRGRDVKETAALIRRDIAGLVSRGALPKGKYSVRIARFSMGCSIDVRVSGLPVVVLNRQRIASDLGVGESAHEPIYSEAGSLILKTIKDLMESYNRDGSDTQTDYFDVDFYGHAAFDYRWETRQRDAIVAQVTVAPCGRGKE